MRRLRRHLGADAAQAGQLGAASLPDHAAAACGVARPERCPDAELASPGLEDVAMRCDRQVAMPEHLHYHDAHHDRVTKSAHGLATHGM